MQQRQETEPYFSTNDMEGGSQMGQRKGSGGSGVEAQYEVDNTERGRNFQIDVAGTGIVFSFRSGIAQCSKTVKQPDPYQTYNTMNTERNKPRLRTEVTMNSGTSGKQNKSKGKVRDDLEDVFKLPLARMPSIVQELVTNMGPERKETIKKELLLSDSITSCDKEESEEEQEEVEMPKHGQLIKSTTPAASERPLSTHGNFVRLQTQLHQRTNSIESGTQSALIGLPRTLETRSLSLTSRDSASFMCAEAPNIEIDPIQEKESNLLSIQSSSIEGKANELLKRLSMRAEEKMNLDMSINSGKTLRRGSNGLSPFSTRKFTQLFSIDNVSSLLVKPHKERSAEDYKEIHEFMVHNIKFFMRARDQANMSQNRTPTGAGSILRMTTEDKMKMYEVMIYKIHNKGAVLCEFGAKGDRFFILLEGQVGVKIPCRKFQKSFNTTWDLYLFLLDEFENVRLTHDYRSRDTLHLIKVIGVKALRKLGARTLVKLVKFLKDCEKATPIFFEEWPEVNETRVKSEKTLINVFMNSLMVQDKEKRFKHTVSQTVSHERPEKDKIKAKLEIMEHVNELNPGDQFGQDALITKDPRNATCYVMTETCKTAELKKNAYDRILAEKERQRVDVKISQILVFDLFKNLTKRRLKNFYRLFFDAKTQQPFVAMRHQYLYRQGDQVDGVFCILSGTVKRIKETWQDAATASRQRSDQEDWEDQLAIPDEKVAAGNDLIRDLKRKHAKQITLTIVQHGEVMGLEEIITKLQQRQYSIQVASENCTYLFLSAKNFREKFINQSTVMKHSLCERLELMDKLHQDLESKQTAAFQMQNRGQGVPPIDNLAAAPRKTEDTSLKRPNQAFEKRQGSVKPKKNDDKVGDGNSKGAYHRASFCSKDESQIVITKLSRECIFLEEKTKVASAANEESQVAAAREVKESEATKATPGHHNRQKIKDMVAFMNQRNSVQSRLTSPASIRGSEMVQPLSNEKQPRGVKPGQAPAAKPSLAQTVHVETEIERLDREIDVEIDKDNIDSQKMLKLVRERRREVTLEHRENNISKEIQMKHLDSRSKIGIFNEKQLCHRFTAIHENQRDRQKMHKSNKKLSIATINQRLVSEAHVFYSKWKTERQEEEQVDLHLKSLTFDKRIQRSLRVFKDKLPSFLEYIRQQGEEYMRKLDLPNFEKSLLLTGNVKNAAVAAGDRSYERSKVDQPTHQIRSMHSQNLSRRQSRTDQLRIKSSNHMQTQPIRTSIHDSDFRLKSSASMASIISPRKQEVETLLCKPPQSSLQQRDRSASRSRSRIKRQQSQSTIRSQMKRGNSGDSGPEIDLLKVFFDWFQHYQVKSKLQQRNSGINRMRSADQMSEQRINVNEKLLQSSQNMTLQYEVVAGGIVAPMRQRSSLRRCFSHFIPSCAMSNFSARSRSRDIIKSPELQSPTNLPLPFQKSLPTLTRTKGQFARTSSADYMIPLTEKVSASDSDRDSPTNRVTFQIAIPTCQDDTMQSQTGYQNKPHRAWFQNRQQSKWLRQNAKPEYVQTERKANQRATINLTDTIPEEQHNKNSTGDSPRSPPRQKFFSPQETAAPRQPHLDQEGDLPQQIIMTEPQTTRNGAPVSMRQAHKDDSLKFLYNSSATFAPEYPKHSISSQVQEPLKEDSQDLNVGSSGQEAHKSNKRVLLTGAAPPSDLEYVINIQAPTSVVNMEQNKIESLQSVITPPGETTKIDQIRQAIKNVEQSDENLVGPPPTTTGHEPNIFDQQIGLGLARKESKAKKNSQNDDGTELLSQVKKHQSKSYNAQPMTKDSLKTLSKGSRGTAALGPTRVPSQYVLSKAPHPQQPNYRTAVRKNDDLEGKETKGKTISSAIKTVDFNSHVVGGHSDYVLSMPFNSQRTSESYLTSIAKHLPPATQGGGNYTQLQSMIPAPPNLHHVRSDYQTIRSTAAKNLSGARKQSWVTSSIVVNQKQHPQTLVRGAQQARSMGQFCQSPPELQQRQPQLASNEISGIQARKQMQFSTLKRENSATICLDKGAHSAAKIKKRTRMSRLERKTIEGRSGMKLGQQIMEKVVNYEQHQMKGFVPRTKVFTSQPNPRFNYPESQSQQARPITANLNLNSARSEANFNSRPMMGNKMRKLNRVQTVETFEKGVDAAAGTESPHFTKNSAFLSNIPTSGRRKTKSRQLQIVSAKANQEQRIDQKPIASQYQSKRFSVKQMSKNVELRHKVIKARRQSGDEKKPAAAQQEAQEYRKFTDRVIQDLQLKAKVQSSRGSLLQREEKPPLLGSLIQHPLTKTPPCAVVTVVPDHPYVASMIKNNNVWEQDKLLRDGQAQPMLQQTRNAMRHGLVKKESTATNNTITGSNMNLNPHYQDQI